MMTAIIFVGVALAYAILKIVLEKRLAPMDTAGVEQTLSNLAFASGLSVYDLFKAAGSAWNFSNGKIENDFKRYLKQGDVPPYVRDYAKKHLLTRDRSYQTLLYAGGRPPYL